MSSFDVLSALNSFICHIYLWNISCYLGEQEVSLSVYLLQKVHIPIYLSEIQESHMGKFCSGSFRKWLGLPPTASGVMYLGHFTTQRLLLHFCCYAWALGNLCLCAQQSAWDQALAHVKLQGTKACFLANSYWIRDVVLDIVPRFDGIWWHRTKDILSVFDRTGFFLSSC